MRLPSSTPALVLAAACLVVGSATGAVAGSMITGAQIKDGTIESVDIQDNTVSSGDIRDGTLKPQDFRLGTIRQGRPGKSGPKGATGATGPAGPQGPAGIGTTLAGTLSPGTAATIPAETCFALHFAADPGSGHVVGGYISTAGGAAALPNNVVVVPGADNLSTQGGTVASGMLCNMRGEDVQIAAGWVLHEVS